MKMIGYWQHSGKYLVGRVNWKGDGPMVAKELSLNLYNSHLHGFTARFVLIRGSIFW